MGQTPSKDKQVSDLYSSYIQQQQNFINQQQSQINDLYQMNLQNIQQMPPNTFFQSDTNQHQQQLPQLPNPKRKIKLDPYKILNISKQYDEQLLKKAYLKAAMKYHPDRGGSPSDFQKVSIAYTLLKQKLKDNDNSHSHDQLKQDADNYFNTQQNQPKVNVNMTENFDVDVFNKIYNENKIKDVYDEGYSSWMNSTNSIESENEKLFQNGFNKDLFNSTFEQYKKSKSQNSQQLTKFTEPDIRISMKNQDSLMTLGRDKISDFGGTTDNLSMTDYKQAFTDNSTLIDTSSVDITGRAHSINGIKSQRSNISYTMTDKDKQYYATQQMQDKQKEQDRLQRLNVYDQKHKASYEQIHSMLLR